MSDWVATTEAPPAWSDLCAKRAALFHSAAWMTLLEQSFSCKSLFFINERRNCGAGLSIFRAGPFRLGYLGFPVGGVLGCEASGREILDMIQQAPHEHRPVAVRVPVSGFGHQVDLDEPYESTAETAIVDLQSWGLGCVSKNRKRDVNRSLRSGLELVEAGAPADADRIFELYRKTLERHDGSMRYNREYFRGLIELARNRSDLRVMLAKADGAVAAFLVVALHESTGYYLHGAFDWSMRAERPSAMLMNEAIEWSKANGQQSFSFLSSPLQQESLIKYKEGWGAITKEHRTVTIPTKASFALFRVAERLYRVLR